MKLVLNEKQLKHIISIEMKEQSDASTSSSTQAGSTGYPQVGKWESGITRGPGNQIGITKWSDVVGASLKRSKGNPLK